MTKDEDSRIALLRARLENYDRPDIWVDTGFLRSLIQEPGDGFTFTYCQCEASTPQGNFCLRCGKKLGP